MENRSELISLSLVHLIMIEGITDRGLLETMVNSTDVKELKFVRESRKFVSNARKKATFQNNVLNLQKIMIKDYIKEGTIKKSNHSVEEKLSIIDKPFQEK